MHVCRVCLSVCAGLQKTATAVAHIKAGKGVIKVNGRPLEVLQPASLRVKVEEPIRLLGKLRFSEVDVRVRVSGGGAVAQIYGALLSRSLPHEKNTHTQKSRRATRAHTHTHARALCAYAVRSHVRPLLRVQPFVRRLPRAWLRTTRNVSCFFLWIFVLLCACLFVATPRTRSPTLRLRMTKSLRTRPRYA